MSSGLNNLVNNTKNITPYTAKIITSDDYLKTNTLLTSNGFLVKGSTSNTAIIADNTVKSGEIGPVLQLYGAGGINAAVGLNFDTFQSPYLTPGGRTVSNNPASRILAIDNGNYSSDLVFYTAPESSISYDLPETEERLRISSNGNVSINNSLSVGGTAYMNNLEISGNLDVEGTITVNKLLKYAVVPVIPPLDDIKPLKLAVDPLIPPTEVIKLSTVKLFVIWPDPSTFILPHIPKLLYISTGE